MTENTMTNPTAQEKPEEITVKFGKGLVGEPFMAKTGRECVSIKVPNTDPADTRPWPNIIVAANRVHENKFGKGMWMKLPADGQTKLYRSELTGQTPEGKNEYSHTTEMIPNKQLKSMLEQYKTKAVETEKSSLRDALRQPGIPGNKPVMKPAAMER